MPTALKESDATLDETKVSVGVHIPDDLWLPERLCFLARHVVLLGERRQWQAQWQAVKRAKENPAVRRGVPLLGGGLEPPIRARLLTGLHLPTGAFRACPTRRCFPYPQRLIKAPTVHGTVGYTPPYEHQPPASRGEVGNVGQCGEGGLVVVLFSHQPPTWLVLRDERPVPSQWTLLVVQPVGLGPHGDRRGPVLDRHITSPALPPTTKATAHPCETAQAVDRSVPVGNHHTTLPLTTAPRQDGVPRLLRLFGILSCPPA